MPKKVINDTDFDIAELVSLAEAKFGEKYEIQSPSKYGPEVLIKSGKSNGVGFWLKEKKGSRILVWKSIILNRLPVLLMGVGILISSSTIFAKNIFHLRGDTAAMISLSGIVLVFAGVAIMLLLRDGKFIKEVREFIDSL